MNSQFNMSIWGNIEDVLCALINVTDNEEVQELCGSDLRVVTMALEHIQTRLEKNSKRAD